MGYPSAVFSSHSTNARSPQQGACPSYTYTYSSARHLPDGYGPLLVAKMLEDFDVKVQPSGDVELVWELATGRFIEQANRVLPFGLQGLG